MEIAVTCLLNLPSGHPELAQNFTIIEEPQRLVETQSLLV